MCTKMCTCPKIFRFILDLNGHCWSLLDWSAWIGVSECLTEPVNLDPEPNKAKAGFHPMQRTQRKAFACFILTSVAQENYFSITQRTQLTQATRRSERRETMLKTVWTSIIICLMDSRACFFRIQQLT